MLTKDLFSLDEAVDIGRTAVVCKRNKQYNLAKMYFVESGQRLSALCRGKFLFEFTLTLVIDSKIPKEKQGKVKSIIEASTIQAEECSKFFNEQVQV